MPRDTLYIKLRNTWGKDGEKGRRKNREKENWIQATKE